MKLTVTKLREKKEILSYLAFAYTYSYIYRNNIRVDLL
jgi:hypothetical protein